MKYLIIIGLLPCLLFSCNKLDEGEIVSKRYEPTNQYLSFIPIMVSCGKNCMITTLIPYYITDNEDYVLTIQGDYKGELRTEEIYVSQKCFARNEVGGHFVADSECSFEDFNNEKVRK